MQVNVGLEAADIRDWTPQKTAVLLQKARAAGIGDQEFYSAFQNFGNVLVPSPEKFPALQKKINSTAVMIGNAFSSKMSMADLLTKPQGPTQAPMTGAQRAGAYNVRSGRSIGLLPLR